jgi:hypothetical protein
MIGSRAAGHPYPQIKHHQRVSRRAIGRTESTEFREFPFSQIIIETESDMHPSDQFYTNCYTTIPGAPEHHVMFPGLYNTTDDACDILFYSSYNGINWHRMPGEPLYRTQAFGAPDGGWIIAHPNLVERKNGDWILPYDGYNVPHKYPRGSYKFMPGMLVWPKGRLAAIEAPEIGAFATVAFVPPGKRLKINAVTQRAGFIKVEIVDMDFNVVAGHSFAESTPIIGNYYYSTVSWAESDELGVATGQPIMIRFYMKMAKIYGLEFE